MEYTFHRDWNGLITWGLPGVTWNGEKFIAGSPADISKFIAVRFSQTTSMIYMPEHMDKKLWRKVIVSNESTIKSICPGINFE